MFGKKKEKAPQYLKSELNTLMMNYNVYHMKSLEIIMYFMGSTVVGGLIGLIFYANLFMKDGVPTIATHISNCVVFFGIGLFAASKFLPMREMVLRDKRKQELNLQFREMLAALSTAFSAGENLFNAFRSIRTEMVSQFGEYSYIVREVDEIIAGIDSNITIDKLLNNFAKRSGLEDVESFSNIINICYQKGGNMKSVVRNTYDLIGDKITISEEIKTKITSNKLQQNFMSVVPIFLIGYLRISNSSFATSFASLRGVFIMTIAAGIFIGAYLYGQKIIDIER